MIPLLDLKAQYAQLKPEIDAAVADVLESAAFILGPQVAALEERVAAYCGCANGIAVASGSDALELALRAVGTDAGAYPFLYATDTSIVIEEGDMLLPVPRVAPGLLEIVDVVDVARQGKARPPGPREGEDEPQRHQHGSGVFHRSSKAEAFRQLSTAT